MQRVMLKSKIHRATVTDCDLHYVGSITVDPELLEAADIREHEQVHVVDIDNGARFETYTIAGEREPARIAAAGRAAMTEFGVEPEYFEIVSTEDLSPLAAIDGEALVAVAARVGGARLIDNTTVRAPARVAAGPHEHDRRETECSV